jgi:hypothetical protein
MASKLVEETAADRLLVFEYAVEEAVDRAIDSFLEKTKGRARELRRLEAAAAAARLHRAGDTPAAWWPAALAAYAPPTATAGELERLDAALERDLRQFYTDLAVLQSLVRDRNNICKRELRVASRAPGVTDAMQRRNSVRCSLHYIERVTREPGSYVRNQSVVNIENYLHCIWHLPEFLDKNPRLTWVETEIGTPAARPEKEAERARMNAQVAGGAPADQPPGYTP